jgi:hypothetical protein
MFNKAHKYKMSWKSIQQFSNCFLHMNRQTDGASLISAPQGCECGQENNKLQLRNEGQNYGRTFAKKIENCVIQNSVCISGVVSSYRSFTLTANTFKNNPYTSRSIITFHLITRNVITRNATVIYAIRYKNVKLYNYVLEVQTSFVFLKSYASWKVCTPALHTHHVLFCLIYSPDIGFHIKNCSIDVDLGTLVLLILYFTTKFMKIFEFWNEIFY